MKKNYGKDISSINTPILFHLPEGGTKAFKNSSEALQWFNENYADNYSMVEYTPTEGDSEHPIELSEVVVTAQAPLLNNSSATRRGVDRWIGANYSPRFNAASAKLGMNPLNWPKHIPTSYWDSQTHLAIHEGNNIAAGIISAPAVAYGAAEYALPWLAKNVAPYMTARGWFAATLAAGNTPAWLTPSSATAIDAVLAGGATGASINDMRENGPTVGNVLGTGLGVVALGAEAVPTLLEGYQLGRKTYNTYRLGKQLNKAASRFDGTVGPEYFNSPSNWYRVTELPEIETIKELGLNVTTTDARLFPSNANRFREFILENKLSPGVGENEGYWIHPRRKVISLRKFGQAHGNTSQAAKGEIWRGTFARSGAFPGYVIEGRGPAMVHRGFNPTTGTDSRTNFIEVPWDDVPFGARIGFHSGEMPVEGLRAFRKLPNGRYLDEGPILPNKTIKYLGNEKD